jgi:hypothetical protein
MPATLATTDMESLRRSLARLRSDPTLGPEGRDELDLIDRLVWLLERTWSLSAPHLVADNERLQTLLEDLAEIVPGCDLAATLGSADAQPDRPPAVLVSHDNLTARNQLLRAALSRVVSETWASHTDAATVVAARARAALREGLESRPW